MGEQHLGAECPESSLDRLGDRKADLCIDLGSWMEHDDLVHHASAQCIQCDVITEHPSIAATDRSGESLEGGEGVRSAGAIRFHSDTALELAQCGIGQWTEETIGSPSIEAELVETSLEFGDVVAGHEMTGYVVHDAVTELPAGFLEAAEGVLSDDAIDTQTPILLEDAHRLLGRVIEGVGTIDRIEESQVNEPGAHFGDGGPGVAAPKVHYKYGARSASKAALGLAPMMVFTTWPPW